MAIGVILPLSAIIGSYIEAFENTDTAAGNVGAFFGTVPDGEVWVVEAACCYDQTTQIDQVAIRKQSGGTSCVIVSVNPVNINDGAMLNTPVTLFPGERLTFAWRGTVLNDNTYANAVGIKYGIDLGI